MMESYFASFDKLEDSVRRGMLRKSSEEKMGVPVRLGLSDVSDDETESDESSAMEKGGLSDAIGFFSAGASGGVQGTPKRSVNKAGWEEYSNDEEMEIVECESDGDSDADEYSIVIYDEFMEEYGDLGEDSSDGSDSSSGTAEEESSDESSDSSVDDVVDETEEKGLSGLFGLDDLLNKAGSKKKGSPRPKKRKKKASEKRALRQASAQARASSEERASRGSRASMALQEEEEESKPRRRSTAESREGDKRGREVLQEDMGGDDSGPSGSTKPGRRQRRNVGDKWWGPSGLKAPRYRGKNVMWTKRSDGSIVRVKNNSKHFKDYLQAIEDGKIKAGEELSVEGGDKSRTKEVIKFKDVKGINGRMTQEARIELAKRLVSMGVASKKDEEFLQRVMDTVASYKLSLGRPKGRSPAELKRDFLDGMDSSNYENNTEYNKAKARLEKLSPEQFDMLLRVIEFDEDDDELRSEFGIEAMNRGTYSSLKSYSDFLTGLSKALYAD